MSRDSFTGVRTRKTWRWIGAMVLAGVLGAWAWAGWVRPNLRPRNFGVVEAGALYRSAALTPAAMKRVVDEHHIRTIVDLGGHDKDPVGERIEQRTAEALGVTRHVFLLEGDGTGNPNAYAAALRVIVDPASRPVLVHCSTGAQRTSGCVMLYKDLVRGEPLEATYPEARGFHHDPARNPRLLPYLRAHEMEIGGALRSGRGIEGFPEVGGAGVEAR